MLDMLDTYLTQMVTPELHASIERTIAIFDRVGLEDYERHYQEVLMVSDNVDVADTTNTILNITFQLQDQILTEHGVTLTESADLDTRTLVIDGLLAIQNYETMSDIEAAATISSDPVEALCEVLSLVTGRTPDELMVEFHYVSAGLISKIVEMASTNEAADVDDEDQAAMRLIVSRAMGFYSYLEAGESLFLQMVRNEIPMGMPFETYLGILGRDIEQLKAEDIALNMMMTALISIDWHQNPISAITKYLETIVADPNLCTSVSIAARNLMTRLGQYESA